MAAITTRISVRHSGNGETLISLTTFESLSELGISRNLEFDNYPFTVGDIIRIEGVEYRIIRITAVADRIDNQSEQYPFNFDLRVFVERV
jgi:hypothetical protein